MKTTHLMPFSGKSRVSTSKLAMFRKILYTKQLLEIFSHYIRNFNNILYLLIITTRTMFRSLRKRRIYISYSRLSWLLFKYTLDVDPTVIIDVERVFIISCWLKSSSFCIYTIKRLVITSRTSEQRRCRPSTFTLFAPPVHGHWKLLRSPTPCIKFLWRWMVHVFGGQSSLVHTLGTKFLREIMYQRQTLRMQYAYYCVYKKFLRFVFV